MKKIFHFLKRGKSKVKRRNLLLLLLLLLVNSYAWFTYVAKTNTSIDASVVSWNVEFYDENAQELDVNITMDDLYPGMDPYNKKVIIKNASDLVAKFNYEIKNLKILGNTYQLSTGEDYITVLNENFPFRIYFTINNTTLNGGDTALFEVHAVWDYESSNNYYKVTKDFVFLEGISYYKKTGSIYELDTTVNQSNFLSKIASGIYIESDDADTFWGEQSTLFKKNNPTSPSLSFDLCLVVTQNED